MGSQLPPKRDTAPQFSVHVYCDQTAGWLKTPLGTEVDLGRGHIVLDGDPALPPKGHSSLPLFSADVYCGHGRPSQLLLSSCLLWFRAVTLLQLSMISWARCLVLSVAAAAAGDSVPVILQQAKMRLWSLSDCVSAYYYATPLMLCAGYKSGYIANCLVRFYFLYFQHYTNK